MAKTYREVLERYDRARAFGEKRSLSEYAAHLNNVYQTDAFSEGLRDGPWTRFSTRTDQVLGDTLGQATGPLGEFVGGLFGEQEAGRRVGEGLPRALLQTAPLYLLGPEAGVPATAAALAGTGALFAGQTYADTGSAKAATLSGVTAAAMPAVGKFGGQLGARVFGAPRIRGEFAGGEAGRAIEAAGGTFKGGYINQIIPTTGAQRGAQFAGSQLAQSVVQEASGYAQHKTLSPETPYDWLSADFLIGQIPFTVYDAVNMTRAPKVTLEQAQGLVKPKTVAPKAELFVRSVEPSVEESLTTEAALAAYRTVAQDETIPAAEKQAKLAAVLASIQAPGTVKAVKEVQKQIDVPALLVERKQLEITGKTGSPRWIEIDQILNGRVYSGPKATTEQVVVEPEITITGKAQPAGPGAWRVRVDVQDVVDQGDITGTTVFVNGVEPTVDPVTGKTTFKVKASQLRPAKFQIAPDPVPDTLQPELPVQESPGALPRRPGVGGGELMSYDSPGLEGQLPGQGLLDARPWGKDSMGRPVVMDTEGNLFVHRNWTPEWNIGMAGEWVPLRETITAPEAQGLAEMGVPPQRIARLVNTLPKSQDLVLDMFQGKVQEDAMGNIVRLGNTDVANAGWMNETRFLKTTQVPQDLMPAFREAYPEAFNEKGEVNATVLMRGLKERPMVEVKKLGGEGDPASKRYGELQHTFFDVATPEQRGVIRDYAEAISSPGARPAEISALETEFARIAGEEKVPLLREFAELDNQSVEGKLSTTKYSFLGPKSEQEMPGYVEGLVRVPTTGDAQTMETLGHIGSVGANQQIKDRAGVKYFGPHFGSEDTNVLAFFRGYEENVGGKKVFHVIEVQSDWGQKRKETDDKVKAIKGDTSFEEESNRQRQIDLAEKQGVPSHPLLSSYETLALKAAIQHAREIGADAVMLSDAETAMMTEGHDKAAQETTDQKVYRTKEEAVAVAKGLGLADADIKTRGNKEDGFVWVGPRLPSQSAGMRLHYDSTLPSALAKLTGQKGERVELGQHKGAAPDTNLFAHPDDARAAFPGRAITEMGGAYGGGGSPVFRNPDGTPKSSITGRLFSLDKVQQGLSMDDTLSLKEAVMKYEQAKVREENARAKTLKVPEKPEEWVEVTKGARETVEKPAFRFDDGSIATTEGRAHALIDIPKGRTVETSGFVTSEGRFIDAKEALRIAQSQGSTLKDSGGGLHATQLDLVKRQTEEAIARGATPTQAAETSRLLTQTPEVAAALKELEVHAEEARTIAEKVEKEKTVAEDLTGAEQHKYGEGVKDEYGNRRMFRKEIDAIKYLDNMSDELDAGNLRVRDGGKNPDGTHKGWYLAPIENLKTSLNRPLGEESSTLENVLAQDTFKEPGQSEIGSTSLPRSAVDNMLETAEILEQSPGTLNRMLRENKLTPEEWAAVKEAWTQDDYDGTEVSHMKAANLLLALQRKPAPYALGSTIPFDEALVEQTGVRRGGRAVVEWLSAQKDLGLVAQLVSKWKNFADLDAMEFVTQGDPRWTPQFSFQQGDMVNLSWLPSAEGRIEWAREVAHEMAHFMERKLSSRNDPAAVQYRKDRADILETLRQSKQLPPKVRSLLDRAIKNNDTARYRAGEDVVSEWKAFLGNKLFSEYYDILYALSDSSGYEMVANAIGYNKMQTFMLNEKVPQKAGAFKSVLNWFSDIYNKLVGGDPTTSNALAELLASHDNYLTGGLLRNIYNGKDFIRDSLIRDQGVRPEALSSRMQTVERTYAKGDLYGSIAGFVREGENGLLPVTAQYMQLDQPLRTALVSGDTKSVFQGTMSLLPDQLPVHQELFYRMQQDVALTRDLVKQVKEGKIQATLPANTEANLKFAGVKLNAMKRALKKQGLALERQADLANFTYDGLDSTIADQLIRPELPDPESQPPEMEQAQALMGLRRMAAPRGLGEVKTESSGKELAGEGLGFLEKTFAMTQFFKKEHPEVRPLVGHVQDEHGKATQTATELNLVLNGRMDPVTGKWEVSVPVRKALERVAGSPTLTSAFSDAVRLMAERAKQNRQWAWSDPEFQAILRPLNPQDRTAVQMVQTQFKLRHDHFVNSVVPEKFSELNHENTATVIQTLEGTMLPEQAREMSKKVYDALQAMMDPARLPLGTALLQDVQRTLSPATFLKALEHANQSIADVNGFLEVARKNLDFVSEQRFDAHHLRMTGPKGEKHYSSAKDVKTLQARREDLERKGWKFEYYTPKADANSTVGGVNAEIMGKFKEMDTLAITRLTAALSGRPDTAQLLETVLPEVRRAEEYAASTQAFKPVPGVTRNLVAGREYLNMIDNAHEFYGRGINWFKHKITRAKTNLDMMHPEIAGNRVLKDWSEQHVKNYLTQDSDVVRKFNEFVFYQRLALNTGNMLLESVQSLGTGMQALIAETGSVRDAFKLTASATKEYIQFLKTKKGSTPELEYLLKKAEATGAAEPTLWDDTYDPNTNSLLGVSAKPGHPVKKGLNIMGALARKPSSALQKMNNNIALIASFKLGMEQGMTREEAFNFARDVKERGTFTGGKPQRSVGLWSIKSRPVPQLMTSLTTYVQGWFNQMAQDYKIGFRGAGSDLTPQQRQGSRKAFVYGLAAQAVLAGGLGLPGVGQGIALLNQATGLDLKGWLRQNLAKLFDEDEDSGGLLTNLALRGAAQAVSPIDPSNRAAIAVPFVGVDPYKGFSIAALAGAPGSSVEDFVKGLFALAQGDSVGYQKLLPSVLKGPAALVQGEGDVRDSRGGLLQTLSPAERWMTGLGLPSSRIQRARDTADTLKKQQAQAQRTKEQMVDEMARLVRSGNVTEVQKRMLELRKQDPTLDLKSLAKSVANRVQAQTIPYDVRRDMNVGSDIAGLQSRLPSTESYRRQVSYDVESSLGFAPSFNPQADAQAMAVDRLLDSNPFLTRSEALRTVRGTRPGPRRFDPSWTQAFQ